MSEKESIEMENTLESHGWTRRDFGAWIDPLTGEKWTTEIAHGICKTRAERACREMVPFCGDYHFL